MTERPGMHCLSHGIVFCTGVTPGTTIVIVGANAVVADTAGIQNHMNTGKPCLMGPITLVT